MARATSLPKGIDGVFALANQVASEARKVSVYEEEGREPPEALSAQLEEKEVELDQLVAELLQKETNLKDAILNSPKLNERNMRELEWSYQRAVSYLEDGGRGSRLFLLPYVYSRAENKNGEKEIDFSRATGDGEQNRKTLLSLLMNFIAENMGEGPEWTGALDSMAIAIGEPLREWVMLEEEEKHLPRLHKAVIHGGEESLARFFTTHREKIRLAAAGELKDVAGNWTMSAIPFVVQHEDEEFLNEIDFGEFSSLFKEEFDQLFDPESTRHYFPPIEPNRSEEEGQLRIWEQLVRMGITEALRLLKKGRALVIDGFVDVEKNGDAAHVSLEIKVGADEAKGTSEELFYLRRIDRPGFGGERASDISTLLMDMPELTRPDVRLLFSRQIVGTGPLGGDGASYGVNDEGDDD